MLFAVQSMSGGTGATTLAVNLAWELANVDKKKSPTVCLIDLDLQFGSTSTYLDLTRRDVIIVASVSCIYGIGSPTLYRDQMQLFKVGETIDRDEVLRKLVRLQYERNDTSLDRGRFRIRGEVIEIIEP